MKQFEAKCIKFLSAKEGDILEGKGVLIAIVAFLSLTLLMLVGYVFFVGGVGSKGEEKEVTQTKRPGDADLASVKVFEAKAYFNLKTNDPNKIAAIQLSVELIHFKVAEGIKNPAEKLAFNKSKIKELIGSYFENLSIDELKVPGMKQRAKEELTKKINDMLLSNEKTKSPIVYTLVFDEWFYQ